MEKTEKAKKQNSKSGGIFAGKPGEIKGKIEIPDTRERRDGPGGEDGGTKKSPSFEKEGE